MGQHNAGSYLPDFERMRSSRSEGVDRSHQPQAKVINNVRASITRNLNIEDSKTIDDWNDFMNSFGAENRYLGQTRSPGNMGITYFSSKQIGQMFADKYSRSTERELRHKIYRASKYFNNFLRDSGAETVRLREETSATIHPDLYNKWLAGSFGIGKDLRRAPNSKMKYAFFLQPESLRTIREEQNEIKKYWKDEGFKERFLGKVDPHITVINLFQTAGAMAVNQSIIETPTTVSLAEPKMTVFEFSHVA